MRQARIWTRAFLAAAMPTLGLVACGSTNNTTPGPSFDSGTDGTGHHDGSLHDPDGSGPLHSDTGTSDAPPDACASTMGSGKVSPLDMYILLDRSGSTAYNDAWEQETSALRNFFNDSQSDVPSISVALQYMPLPQLCEPSAYAQMAVPLGTLADAMQRGTLVTSLGTSQPFGGTPTTVALEGVLQTAEANQKAQPTHKVVIVIATDGTPDSTSCQVVPDGGLINNSTTAQTVISQAAAAGIDTFVIGVGVSGSADAGVTTQVLNDFATAGGTKAIFVSASGPDGGIVDIEGSLLSAFNAIRGEAVPCTFPVPTPAGGGSIDFSDVNLTFTPGVDAGAGADAGSQQWYGVASASDCKHQTNDWYFDNPSDPKNILLCPVACATAQADLSASIDVVFGCTPTLPPPPNLK